MEGEPAVELEEEEFFLGFSSASSWLARREEAIEEDGRDLPVMEVTDWGRRSFSAPEASMPVSPGVRSIFFSVIRDFCVLFFQPHHNFLVTPLSIHDFV